MRDVLKAEMEGFPKTELRMRRGNSAQAGKAFGPAAARERAALNWALVGGAVWPDQVRGAE